MKTKTWEDVKKYGLDSLDRARAKHLIRCRDKWNQEAMDRLTMEIRGKVGNTDWSDRAKAHADSLNSELEALLRKTVVIR